MCVKLLPEDLNPDPSLTHLTNTYTCKVTIASRVCGDIVPQCSNARERLLSFILYFKY